MDQKYLVYESLRNVLTLIQLLLMVKQTYEDYKNVLMCFDLHLLRLLIIQLMENLLQVLLLVHLLQFLLPNNQLGPKVMNNLLHQTKR